jgi:hypothetical protein
VCAEALDHNEPDARDQTQEKDESDRLQTGIVMPSLSSENGSRIIFFFIFIIF